MQAEQSEPKWINWLEWATLLAVVALAAYLRFWRISEVPPGFNSDEAVGAVGALTTLREGLRFSYEGQGGGGVLGFYFVAAFFYLFGPSIATARATAAWAGVMSIFFNYWAIRELFRGSRSSQSSLNYARLLAFLSTLGLAVSVWHIQSSRITFAGIGVPFLMLPSVYFLWKGLNNSNKKTVWPFILSGVFLGGLMYIYLSGVFFPPFYAIFFVAQWLIVTVARKLKTAPKTGFFSWKLEPSSPYMTTRFWNLFAVGLTATVLLIPLVYVLLVRPELDPSSTRVSQAFFLNPLINKGDPWGLLWRSFTGNFAAYGVSFSWLIGRIPRMVSAIPPQMGLIIFLGFLISVWRALRGQSAYLFVLLWFAILLLPSILAPDAIPHNLRTIGATTPLYIFAAIFIVTIFDVLRMTAVTRPKYTKVVQGLSVLLLLGGGWLLWSANFNIIHKYFYIFPETNDAKAAYHVYAVKMAEEINREPNPNTAFILPRNTAAGDVFRNFTVDFLTELEQPPAAHYWVIDDETTIPAALTAAAAEHDTIRVVRWKTSKHTGADPKKVIPYYLEKYGDYERTDSFEYFDIDTYRLKTAAPNFYSGETLQPVDVSFGGQLQLTGYALGNAGEVEQVTQLKANSGDLLWMRLAWRKTANHPENIKVSVLIYGQEGQLITQVDKTLVSNLLQVKSKKWAAEAQEETYFLINIPPATPPGLYNLQVAVYGEDSLTRLPITVFDNKPGTLFSLTDFMVQPATKTVLPDELDIALPVMQELLPGLTLAGFESLPGKTVHSGDEIRASLLWLTGDSPLDDLSMLLIAKAGEGNEEWQLSEPVGLAGSGYPSSSWQAGEILRGWLKARIPPSFEPGLYKLRLRLVSANKKEVTTLPIGDFQVEGWTRNFTAPKPQIEIKADFNGLVTLVGIDTDSMQISPGGRLTATLHWRVEAEFKQNYTAFIHIIGADGLLYGQVDQIPGAGEFPTTGWLKGEYITDNYTVAINKDAPPGDYQIEVGMYDPNTGQRLTVNKTDDKLLLPGLTVR